MFYENVQISDFVINRLWERVDRRSDDECWNWIGCVSGGYGRVYIHRKSYLAHRLAYFLVKGPIPHDRSLICHKCDNSLCCNPNHSYAGTYKDNMFDAVSRYRHRTLRGSKSLKAKISDETVTEIRFLHMNGRSRPGIAKHLGLPVTTVDSALVNWKHLGWPDTFRDGLGI